jgi:myo-inositol-1(or 4)-monophosphatase
VAAGALLVREAGGRVTAFDGGDAWLYGRNIVASNGAIHDDISRRLTPFQEGEA